MDFYTCRPLTLLVVWLAVGVLVSAQITFSRDWTGGKRASPQLALDCNQFTTLCRKFLHELKRSMSEGGMKNRNRSSRDSDDFSAPYDDDK